MRLYHDRLPGDVENVRRMSQLHSGMFRRYPCLMYFLILLKYGHPRDLWTQECLKNGMAQKDQTLSVKQLVSSIPAVLQKVTLKLDGWWECDAAKAWVHNCGKGVSHVLGPLPLLHALGVIVADNRKIRNKSRGTLRFGLQGRKHRAATSSAKKKEATDGRGYSPWVTSMGWSSQRTSQRFDPMENTCAADAQVSEVGSIDAVLARQHRVRVQVDCSKSRHHVHEN